jgi:hypothetical protein
MMVAIQNDSGVLGVGIMDRQDARGFRGDGGFHLFQVQVAESGPDVVPPQGVRGGHKAEGRGV